MAKIDSGKDFDKNANHEKVMKNMDNMDTKPYLFNIPTTLYKKVKRKMLDEERTLRDVLIEHLNKYINE